MSTSYSTHGETKKVFVQATVLPKSSSEMFSKILSTSLNDGYSSSMITNMVTASDVDKSATSIAETPTSEMSTSYSTHGETKKVFVLTTVLFNPRSCRTDYHFRSEFSIWVYKLVELIMRINNAPPAFPLQNVILPPQRAQL
ncbi:Hypothetical predicted protein [Mytilus galloprovincialis]|uniref:Uncharacterized protein n=1 Tax=Mytilus galloprovincialis TaxID=29158 RepID=A0A8B6DI48_MYTGA|nr:Hypothetical predicted protein [Mytilus galloprovincialis]